MVASFSLRKERVSESVLHKVGIIYRDCDSVCVCSSDCVAHLFFKQQMSLALLLLCVCVCVHACVCVIHPDTVCLCVCARACVCNTSRYKETARRAPDNMAAY